MANVIMDPITHGLLGAAASQSITARSIGKKAAIVGALAGMSPDLDIFIHSSDNPMLGVLYHRHFTHALAFVPVGGLIVALFCLLIFKSLRAKWPYVFIAALAAYCTHSLLDTATSYGTLLWWPFSYERVSWDLISIVDPIFTCILAVGVIFAYRKQMRRPALIALCACLAYLGFGYYQHSRAIAAQTELAQQRHQIIEKNRVMPALGHLFGYRSLYISHDQIYLDEIKTPLFKSAYAFNGIAMPLFHRQNLPITIEENSTLFNDFSIFNWFSDGYISALSQQPLILADMRYIRSLDPFKAAWVIEFPTDSTRQHVYWRSAFSP